MTISPFCRRGSKKSLLGEILPIIPDHNLYIEPFVGAGAVFFAKEPAPKSVINDLDETLYRGYKAIPDLSTDLESYNFQEGVSNIQQFVDTPQSTVNNRFLQLVYRLCNTFRGIARGKIYMSYSQKSKFKHVGDWKKRMSNTKVLNVDYLQILKSYDSPKAFFYLDPPYEEGSRRSQQYKSIDYEELADRLEALKGKFLLSINDSANIRKIFKGRGFYFRTVKVKRPLSYGLGVIGQTKELLIANYKF